MNIHSTLQTVFLGLILIFSVLSWHHLSESKLEAMGLWQTQVGVFHHDEKTLYVYDDSGRFLLKYDLSDRNRMILKTKN